MLRLIGPFPSTEALSAEERVSQTEFQARSQRSVPVANNEEPLQGHIKAKGASHI